MNFAAAVVCGLLFAGQATPPRDRPVTGPANAVIRGRVVAAATGEPLHRVRVTLNTANPNPPTAVTDTRGQFEMTVPAGSYSMTASRAGYLSIQYGQRRPREAGRAIELRAGDVLEGVDMALPRGGVLAGVISDEAAEQYAGVRVEALEYRYLRGRRVLLQAASATTNDLGQFRLSNLAPGVYVLRASSADTWDGDDGQTTFAYATTYFPGVTRSDQAQSIEVAVGQEVSALDFTLRPGRTATINGVMQNSAGETMAAQTIGLGPVTRGVGGMPFSTGGPGSTTTRTDAKGAFEFRNLAPGEYMLSAGSAAERESVSVTVADGDVRTVSLVPRKPRALYGNVVTADGKPAPFPPARLRVVPVDADSDLPAFSATRETTVQGDWSFRWTDIEGRHWFRVQGLPRGWMLDAVTFNGRNITDSPLDLPAGDGDVKGLQLVISDQGGTVEGSVRDANDNPAPDSTVIVFSADPAHWTTASRYVTAVRPDHTGKFSLAALPRGVYRAVARDMVMEGQWEDPAFLNSLVPASVRFTLDQGATATLTLKLEPPR